MRKKAAQEEAPTSQSKPSTPPAPADQSDSKNIDQSEAEEMPDLNDPEVQDAAIKIQVLNDLEMTLKWKVKVTEITMDCLNSSLF